MLQHHFTNLVSWNISGNNVLAIYIYSDKHSLSRFKGVQEIHCFCPASKKETSAERVFGATTWRRNE
jgi:hypothetical protein